MKIAVSASEPSLDAELDPRFGRCAYFVVFDTTSEELETAPNPHASATGGAGVQAARLVSELGAERVLYGSDAPGRDFAAQLGRVYGAKIGAAEREMILGGNARKLLGD